MRFFLVRNVSNHIYCCARNEKDGRERNAIPIDRRCVNRLFGVRCWITGDKLRLNPVPPNFKWPE